jgi:hypothetical protein
MAAMLTILPAQASEVGNIAVMKQGTYQCETPGNALGKTGAPGERGFHHPARLGL